MDGMHDSGGHPLANRIERHVWLVVKPAIRDDIDAGQLRVNMLDAVEAALRSVER